MRTRNKAGIAISVVLSLTLLGSGLGTVPQVAASAAEELDDARMSAVEPDYGRIIEAEAAWLAKVQLPSGVLPMYSEPNYGGKYRVVPYFANIAALGWLEKEKYADKVKTYIEWYFDHMNVSSAELQSDKRKKPDEPDHPVYTDYNGLNGTVYDYTVEPDRKTETPLNKYDSTDSYAATIISLLRKYVEVTNDSKFVKAHKQEIETIAEVMVATQQNDGLTWAMPDFQVKYLMDNAEVYKGFEDAEWIFRNVIHDRDTANNYRSRKEAVAEGIERELWDPAKGAYRPYKDNGGGLGSVNWDSFYPDATAQLFPIWTGLIEPDSERALQLYNTFNEHHPGWPKLEKPDGFPWALIAYTAAIMGDKTRVDTYLQSVKTTYIDQGHPWTWYNMESGVTIMAAKIMKTTRQPKFNLQIANPAEGQQIARLPLVMTGTSKGIAKIEMKLTHLLTGTEKSVSAKPAADGTWSMSFDGLLNGDYRAEAIGKDQFNNVQSAKTINFSVKIASDEPLLKNVLLTSDRMELHRGETAQLSVATYVEDQADPVQLPGAHVEFRTSRDDLVQIGPQGTLKLVMIDPAVSSIDVRAVVTNGSDVAISNTVTIQLSTAPLTSYDAVIDAQANWILGMQLPNGAILNDKTTIDALNGKYKVDPRLSALAAIGLLERPEYAPQAKKYIDWYMTHWNWPDPYGIYGTAYEYSVDPATLEMTALNSHESGVSQNAAFLSLVRKYVEVTGLNPGINQFQTDIMTGGIGILKSQDQDGLIWKHPASQVKQLTDNSAIYKGLTDSVWLFRNYFQASGPADYFDGYRGNMLSGIQGRLWNDSLNLYHMSIDGAGTAVLPDLSKPSDALAQLAPIYTGVLAPDDPRSLDLYDRFKTAVPNWATSESIGETSYAAAAYTAALLGDKQAVDTYLQTLMQQTSDAGPPAGWNVFQAAMTMAAAHKAQAL